jgi:signal transduction histidine kinase
VIIAGLLLVGAATRAVRRRRAGRPARRGVALTVDAFGVSLVMLATLYLAALSSWPAFEALRNVTFAVLGLAPIAFLFGLLDARLARADVGELVVRLRADPTGNLRQHLADALHDPTLAVAYWLPQAGSWADQSGRRVRLPEPGRGRATRLIRQDDQPAAALIFDHSLEDERELLDAVVAAAAIALENGRLESELRAQLHELRDSRVRVLEAGRKERQRLERNLHDGAQQRLVALTLELGRWENDLTNPKDRVRIGRVRSQLAESLGELRDVSRGIYPAVLTGHGLAVALESLTARTAVPVRLDVTVGDRLPEAVEVAAYYIVAEGLTNLDKHAQARSAAVRVAPASDGVVVEVCDDGRGGADALGGSGLRGLADRVEALGGTLQIWSPPGEGTRLTADLPIPADGEGPRSTTGGLPK